MQIYLKPGEIHYATQPTVVTTVLGSCVAATFFHRPTGLAAICHALQPRCANTGQCPGQCATRGRFADCAIEAMSHWMIGRKVPLREIEIKLFGGAALMGRQARVTTGTIANSMGQLNIQAALETLKSNGIALKVADVGGTVGRKIIFDTATGEVWLKRLNASVVTDGGALREAGTVHEPSLARANASSCGTKPALRIAS
jgi:chemotaxis protein CheD